MDDQYYEIAVPARIEIKRKGSRFIAETGTVDSVEEAQRQLESIRKREHAATHHCYAYRVGIVDEACSKYSDDGEPGGTAGRPIYDVICGCEVTNALLVVTRYFGGTKLGTGGLARAYGDAAKEAMDRSGRKECFLTELLSVQLEFPLYDRLVKLARQYEARQKDAEFSERVSVRLQVRRSLVDRLTADIIKLSGGKARIEKLG